MTSQINPFTPEQLMNASSHVHIRDFPFSLKKQALLWGVR